MKNGGDAADLQPGMDRNLRADFRGFQTQFSQSDRRRINAQASKPAAMIPPIMAGSGIG